MGMNGKWKEKKQHKNSHFRHSEFLFFLFSVVKTKSEWQEREEKRDKHKWLVFSFHDFPWNSFIWIFISSLFILALFKRFFLSSFSLLHFSPSIHLSCKIKMNWFLFEFCENEMESNIIQLCLISFHLNHNDSFGCEFPESSMIFRQWILNSMEIVLWCVVVIATR